MSKHYWNNKEINVCFCDDMLPEECWYASIECGTFVPLNAFSFSEEDAVKQIKRQLDGMSEYMSSIQASMEGSNISNKEHEILAETIVKGISLDYKRQLVSVVSGMWNGESQVTFDLHKVIPSLTNSCTDTATNCIDVKISVYRSAEKN